MAKRLRAASRRSPVGERLQRGPVPPAPGRSRDRPRPGRGRFGVEPQRRIAARSGWPACPARRLASPSWRDGDRRGRCRRSISARGRAPARSCVTALAVARRGWSIRRPAVQGPPSSTGTRAVEAPRPPAAAVVGDSLPERIGRGRGERHGRRRGSAPAPVGCAGTRIADRIEPGGDEIGEPGVRPARQHQGQRAGPEAAARRRGQRGELAPASRPWPGRRHGRSAG